ncbi:MAG: DUF3096 domain-containing protein [Candidatus Pacearchaeota archaeon]
MVTLISSAIPVITIIAGIVVLIWRRALNIVVGTWLIIYGILQIIGSFFNLL